MKRLSCLLQADSVNRKERSLHTSDESGVPVGCVLVILIFCPMIVFQLHHVFDFQFSVFWNLGLCVLESVGGLRVRSRQEGGLGSNIFNR